MKKLTEYASELRSLHTLAERNSADPCGYMHCTQCGKVYVHPEEGYSHRCSFRVVLSNDVIGEAERQNEADAALGRAVREASAGPVLMNAWANDESMPDVVRRVFRAIAETLRKEQGR